ncbi:MAG TPA: L-glutamate gamma-semialdehyde dehydrogenase [Puia sp.]
MNLGYFHYAMPSNEPVLNYAPGSAEKISLKKAIREIKAQEHDIPMIIGGKEIRTGNKIKMSPPHEISHTLGYFHRAGREQIEQAVEAALQAKPAWERLNWENRAAIFLKAADLLAGKHRAYMNAATMIGQSKNPFQSEIDGICELIDFLRFNVHYLSEIYRQQPSSSPGVHNRMEYRPLEGFVLAITPFNFTAIAGNLPSSAALCGNTVVWKPADTQVFSAHFFMRILQEAGLPDGVINLVYPEGTELGSVCFSHRDFAGIHFTGSTAVFNKIWKTIGENIGNYKSYPRIVGETGGKDFVLVHPEADAAVAVTALVRGAFEFQGQKCSAASRAYLPSNLAAEIREKLLAAVKTLRVGTVEDFRNFVNAVIDEKSFDKIRGYIDRAEKDPKAKIIAGGKTDKSKGYFIDPTIIETSDPEYITLKEEIFGPVLTIYVYPEQEFEQTLDLVNRTSPYALTGSIISRNRQAIEQATEKLRQAAGNFYINDKPTGAVVGQQPFGGARGSGTNDKAGSILNLYRWLSARTIKETFQPATDHGYPFLGEA